MNKWKKISFIQIGIIGGVIFFVFTINFIADPFNYNNYFDLGFNKDHISKIMNYRLFNLIKYKNKPKPIVLLGDSRGLHLREEYFKKCGFSVANVSYGGGTLYEAIDTFWLIIKNENIKAVILVIPFNIYNENNKLNLVPQAINILENPTYYYLNFLTTKATLANLYYKLTNRYLRMEKPAVDKELFWQQQLGASVTGAFYRGYKYPSSLLIKLLAIAQEAKKRDIKVMVVLPPTHIDLQNKIDEYSLNDNYKKYKEDLTAIGEFLDYDTKTDITMNKNNFTDPYHFNSEIANSIANDICQKLSYSLNK